MACLVSFIATNLWLWETVTVLEFSNTPLSPTLSTLQSPINNVSTIYTITCSET